MFYVDSRECVWVGMDVNEGFPVNVILRQGRVRFHGCLMYIILMYICQGVLEGLELMSANDGRFEINQLLFADDTALVADSEENLCRVSLEYGGTECVE